MPDGDAIMPTWRRINALLEEAVDRLDDLANAVCGSASAAEAVRSEGAMVWVLPLILITEPEPLDVDGEPITDRILLDIERQIRAVRGQIAKASSDGERTALMSKLADLQRRWRRRLKQFQGRG